VPARFSDHQDARREGEHQDVGGVKREAAVTLVSRQKSTTKALMLWT
jgi:hypothetical protein